jgi:hypothetical protein
MVVRSGSDLHQQSFKQWKELPAQVKPPVTPKQLHLQPA